MAPDSLEPTLECRPRFGGPPERSKGGVIEWSVLFVRFAKRLNKMILFLCGGSFRGMALFGWRNGGALTRSGGLDYNRLRVLIVTDCVFSLVT